MYSNGPGPIFKLRFRSQTTPWNRRCYLAAVNGGKTKTRTDPNFVPATTILHCFSPSLSSSSSLVRAIHRSVRAKMGNQIDEKPPVKPAPKLTFCQRNKSENGSFVSSLRNHFHEFIHASVDEHKTCLRNTIHKIVNASKIFGKSSDSSTDEGEKSLPLHSSTRN